MEVFARLFGSLLLFVYHCFDRVVIHGYLSGLSRPGQMVHFFHDVVGEPVIDKTVLSRRTNEYRDWVEAFARNHDVPIEWTEPKVRKEDYVRPAQRRMKRAHRHGVYFILKSMDSLLAPFYSATVVYFYSALDSSVCSRNYDRVKWCSEMLSARALATHPPSSGL